MPEHDGADLQATHFKKQIFDSLIGFCTSNSAHTRCMAQYFVRLMFEDSLFRPFIPQGHEILLTYFDKCKTISKILKKYAAEVAKLSALVMDSTAY